MRLPGHRRFRVAESHATWDGASIPEQSAQLGYRNTLLALPQVWGVSEWHTLRLFAHFRPPAPGEGGITFSSDAFFLPSEGWAPELLPSEGLFGTGGEPPKKWPLLVRVPAGFLIHTSGRSIKSSAHNSEITVESVQYPEDRYPFVAAGIYKQTLLNTDAGKVLLWTRAQEEAAHLKRFANDLVLAIRAYDANFGPRSPNAKPFWIVECPEVSGCFTSTESPYASLLSAKPESVSSELISLDTLMIDVAGGAPELAAAAPSLAASWLGYGRNPAFYEQQPPLSAFPAFASALGEEAIDGPASRTETIRRALRMIPVGPAASKPESEAVLRAKSFLFFFALQERYGPEAFRHAINHMLSARQGRGFRLDDLIAAFEEETHQNVAEFVRLWMKHPGVPGDFRERFENASASIAANSKETKP